MAAAKQRHIDRLVDIFYDMGAQGTMWEEVGPDDLQDQRRLLSSRPARLSVPHLGQIVLAWERWTKDKPPKANLYQPTPTHLGLFLHKQAVKGPTVAPSRMRGFRWLRQNLGVPFPVDAAVVRDFRHAPPEHEPQQARCLSPGDFVNALSLARQEGGCIQSQPAL